MLFRMFTNFDNHLVDRDKQSSLIMQFYQFTVSDHVSVGINEVILVLYSTVHGHLNNESKNNLSPTVVVFTLCTYYIKKKKKLKNQEREVMFSISSQAMCIGNIKNSLLSFLYVVSTELGQVIYNHLAEL